MSNQRHVLCGCIAARSDRDRYPELAKASQYIESNGNKSSAVVLHGADRVTLVILYMLGYSRMLMSLSASP